MKRFRATRGFTLIEVTVACGLMAIFLSAFWWQFHYAARASAQAGRGAAEVAAALRMAEQFRLDVRQALSADVSPGGDRVVLATPKSKIEYRIGESRRLERTESQESSSGPMVRGVQFEWRADERLLLARWACMADLDVQSVDENPDIANVRVLVLDTALRAEGPGGAPR